MNKIRRVKPEGVLQGYTILEYRNGSTSEGIIVDSKVYRDETFGIVCEIDSEGRDMVFSSEEWNCRVQGKQVELIRKASPNSFSVEAPPHDATRYVLCPSVT